MTMYLRMDVRAAKSNAGMANANKPRSAVLLLTAVLHPLHTAVPMVHVYRTQHFAVQVHAVSMYARTAAASETSLRVLLHIYAA